MSVVSTGVLTTRREKITSTGGVLEVLLSLKGGGSPSIPTPVGGRGTPTRTLSTCVPPIDQQNLRANDPLAPSVSQASKRLQNSVGLCSSSGKTPEPRERCVAWRLLHDGSSLQRHATGWVPAQRDKKRGGWSPQARASGKRAARGGIGDWLTIMRDFILHARQPHRPTATQVPRPVKPQAGCCASGLPAGGLQQVPPIQRFPESRTEQFLPS